MTNVGISRSLWIVGCMLIAFSRPQSALASTSSNQPPELKARLAGTWRAEYELPGVSRVQETYVFKHDGTFFQTSIGNGQTVNLSGSYTVLGNDPLGFDLELADQFKRSVATYRFALVGGNLVTHFPFGNNMEITFHRTDGAPIYHPPSTVTQYEKPLSPATALTPNSQQSTQHPPVVTANTSLLATRLLGNWEATFFISDRASTKHTLEFSQNGVFVRTDEDTPGHLGGSSGRYTVIGSDPANFEIEFKSVDSSSLRCALINDEIRTTYSQKKLVYRRKGAQSATDTGH